MILLLFYNTRRCTSNLKIHLILDTDVMCVAKYILVVEKETGKWSILFHSTRLIPIYLMVNHLYLVHWTSCCSLPAVSKWQVLWKESLYCHYSKNNYWVPVLIFKVIAGCAYCWVHCREEDIQMFLLEGEALLVLSFALLPRIILKPTPGLKH